MRYRVTARSPSPTRKKRNQQTERPQETHARKQTHTHTTSGLPRSSTPLARADKVVPPLDSREPPRSLDLATHQHKPNPRRVPVIFVDTPSDPYEAVVIAHPVTLVDMAAMSSAAPGATTLTPPSSSHGNDSGWKSSYATGYEEVRFSPTFRSPDEFLESHTRSCLCSLVTRGATWFNLILLSCSCCCRCYYYYYYYCC